MEPAAHRCRAFLAAFLAAQFDYPAVLDGNAEAVLPRLLALGNSGRAVWAVYALLPLLLIPASEATAGHGTTASAKWYAKELRELLQATPGRCQH